MDLSTVIICVVAGAFLGALGYLAALFAERQWGFNRSPYWIAAVGALFGVLAGGMLSQPSASGPIAVGDVLPYMQLIKDREPLLYERIETSVIRDQEDGVSADQIRANAKSLVMSFVADAASKLPDDLTYELYATLRDQLAYLGDHTEFQACSELALGRARGDIDAKLSKELIDRSNNNTVRVVTALSEERKRKTPTEFKKMPAEEFAQLAASSFAEASQTSGVPPEDVDNILAGSGDASKTCKLMKAFFDAILAQPVDVAASALRTLATGERASTP